MVRVGFGVRTGRLRASVRTFFVGGMINVCSACTRAARSFIIVVVVVVFLLGTTTSARLFERFSFLTCIFMKK